ncbi:transcriptional activator RinB [Staphylococcus aureus]|uniref:transcriptional activator RinB n=1 Tax=Staphylococcus aureus TaxID=1280 RepID=UPI0020A831BA|nr:transcriptional activator RinB [Staphylococcus aureus]
MTEVKIKTISGDIYYSSIDGPIEDMFTRVIDCAVVAGVETFTRQKAWIRADNIEAIICIGEANDDVEAPSDFEKIRAEVSW